MEKNIRIRVERRKIKNINMYLRPPYDEVLVTAPIRMPEAVIKKFIREKEPWIERNIERLSSREQKPFVKPDVATKKRYTERLNRLLPDMLSLWQSRLQVEVSSWRLRVMKTCWGVCHTGKRTISFNTLLGAKSEECIEYIVLHELCHLLEPGHNKRFYSFMDAFMPDWRERKKKFNE